MRRIDTLVIHHSASRSGSVPEFRELHRKRLRVNDIGYHELIGNGNGIPDGHISRGRPHERAGVGVWGNNTGKLHVCLVGNFEASDRGYTGPPSRKQMAALGHWLLVNAARYRITNEARVVGHKEITRPGHGTACPGSKMPLTLIRLWFDANQPLFEQGDHEALDAYLAKQGVELS